MRADKGRRRPREGGGGEAAQLAFYAAHIGHDRAGAQGGGNAAGELNDASHGGGEHDEIGLGDGSLGAIGYGVAPGLVLQREAHFGAARPQHDAGGEAAIVGGTRYRGAEQAGGEDGKSGYHAFGQWRCCPICRVWDGRAMGGFRLDGALAPGR